MKTQSANPNVSGNGTSPARSRGGSPILHGLSVLFDRLPSGFFRRANQIAIDAVLCAFSIALAFNLRFDFRVPPFFAQVMWLWIILLPVVRTLGMSLLGAYRGVWRYFNLQDALDLTFSAIPASLVMLALRAVGFRTWVAAIPFTVTLIELGSFLALAVTVRALRRATSEISNGKDAQITHAVIVGTEETIAGALRHLSIHPEIRIVGLFAPESNVAGLHIGGLPVLDNPNDLPDLLAKKTVDTVLIADASMHCISAIVATATEFGVDIRLLPSASSVVRGEVRIAAPPKAEMAFMERGVALAETSPVVQNTFRGRNVLVTGAGGSIGSEICRQVMHLEINTLILLDQDENSIFELNNELRALGKPADILPLVGDIRDSARIQHLFNKHRPDIVLHAAAYKHVPVMEHNCSEAILNNIIGTRVLADAAAEFGCERFLMISTDKAVNPISVMGASKRVAEVLVQSRAQLAQKNNCATRFACVRFGNVVGSRGSVVPIFLKQIASGEPLTITDEAMTRYFMTIPEAVQLVLQACTLGADGNIYMLDMGDPIKIKNLARKLIEMSGLRPDKDIEIRVIGLRPGEKLHEEMWHQGAKVSPTTFARVFELQAEEVPEEFEPSLSALEQTALMRVDEAVYQQLFGMPVGFPTDEKFKAAAAAMHH